MIICCSIRFGFHQRTLTISKSNRTFPYSHTSKGLLAARYASSVVGSRGNRISLDAVPNKSSNFRLPSPSCMTAFVKRKPRYEGATYSHTLMTVSSAGERINFRHSFVIVSALPGFTQASTVRLGSRRFILHRFVFVLLRWLIGSLHALIRLFSSSADRRN